MRAAASALAQRCLRVEVVVELFAGSCRWSHAASLAGEFVISLDLRFGAEHDLTLRRLQNLVLGWVQGGAVKYLLAGFPCRSFSRARNIPGGPPALRSGDFIAGLPGLRPADAANVLEGNGLLRFVVRLATCCLRMRVPAVLENPWTSWAWDMAAMSGLRRRRDVRLVRSDFCMWGMPWRKSTGFLALYCDTTGIERTCCGRPLCSRSGRPHIQLRGSFQGTFLTHLAEPYPRTLCNALVRMLRFAHMHLQSLNLDGLFCRINDRCVL